MLNRVQHDGKQGFLTKKVESNKILAPNANNQKKYVVLTNNNHYAV